jgi:glucokinase
MKAKENAAKERLYLGVDVGGTKVQAALVSETGTILARQRSATPRTGGPEQVLAVIENVIEETLSKAREDQQGLAAIGIAVPGVVDPDRGQVVFTPNMSLTGVALGAHLEGRFKVPVAVGNDCNLGALGERWLGSARNARSVMVIMVGTGIGGGFVRKRKLWRGAREAAAEIGHIVMQINGPPCGCGNRGCLEALASRSAIEREIRSGIAAGRPSILPELCGGDLGVIRSGAIRKALDCQDPLVTEVVRRAAEILGHACLTVRHLLDPEVIVLGGGVIEACSEFIAPIVENIVGNDHLPGAREGGQVLLSALGDDAVTLGAVALARKHIGRSPFKKRFQVMPRYPQIRRVTFGEITVGRKSHNHDIYISVQGKVRKRQKSLAKQLYGNAHIVGPNELDIVCRGGPEVLIVGTGKEGRVELTEEACRYLNQRSIRLQMLPTSEAVGAYNRCEARKAALIHVTC